MLTHFSGRYPTIPNFGDQHKGRAAIAMDFMTIDMARLHKLPALVAPLEVLFAATLAEFAAEAEATEM